MMTKWFQIDHPVIISQSYHPVIGWYEGPDEWMPGYVWDENHNTYLPPPEENPTVEEACRMISDECERRLAYGVHLTGNIDDNILDNDRILTDNNTLTRLPTGSVKVSNGKPLKLSTTHSGIITITKKKTYNDVLDLIHGYVTDVIEASANLNEKVHDQDWNPAVPIWTEDDWPAYNLTVAYGGSKK